MGAAASALPDREVRIAKSGSSFRRQVRGVSELAEGRIQKDIALCKPPVVAFGWARLPTSNLGDTKMELLKTEKIVTRMPDGTHVTFFGCVGPEEHPTESYAVAIACPANAPAHATNFWQTIQLTLTSGYDEARIVAAVQAMDILLKEDLA